MKRQAKQKKETRARGKSRDKREREIIEMFSRFSPSAQRAILGIFEEAFSPKHEGRTQ